MPRTPLCSYVVFSETDEIIAEKPGAQEPGTLRGEIVFDHVAFGYSAERPVLRDVSFTIKPGAVVGMVGHSDSGKTTLAGLIPRLRDVNQGAVRIDGVDVRDYKLSGLRKNIGIILMSTPLTYETIRQNIARARTGATEDEVVEAAKLANAHDFISQMASGYDTQIGECWKAFSISQRQRIGVARAFVQNPPILILDEATHQLAPSGQLRDSRDSLLVSALERLMDGRTVINITHHLSTIRSSDTILVLDGGVVAETGTRDELMALNGVYARIHNQY
jgi:ABC-type multidrug transport system fused ATPase/permease subunit